MNDTFEFLLKIAALLSWYIVALICFFPWDRVFIVVFFALFTTAMALMVQKDKFSDSEDEFDTNPTIEDGEDEFEDSAQFGSDDENGDEDFEGSAQFGSDDENGEEDFEDSAQFGSDDENGDEDFEDSAQFGSDNENGVQCNSPAETALMQQLGGLETKQQKVILDAFRMLSADLTEIKPPIPTRILVKNLVFFFYGNQGTDQVAEKMLWLRSSPFPSGSEKKLLSLIDLRRLQLMSLM